MNPLAAILAALGGNIVFNGNRVESLLSDGIGGIPMTSGPFPGFNVNFDFTALHITSVSPIPLPAATWLFGSGLLGLLGFAGRRKRAL